LSEFGVMVTASSPYQNPVTASPLSVTATFSKL
jgi:hypothetical protein